MTLLRKYYDTGIEGGGIPDEVSKLPECTLSDIELVKIIDKWNGMLCKSGGQAWVLRVPPDPNYDPDLLISELCKRFSLASEELARLKEENERLRGEGWMSVKDGFPESGENVLLHHSDYGLGIGYGIKLDKSFAGTFHGVPVIDENNKVTHWQPLPPH